MRPSTSRRATPTMADLDKVVPRRAPMLKQVSSFLAKLRSCAYSLSTAPSKNFSA
jgi:hypothetical protein